MDYLEGNTELVMEALLMLDLVKINLQLKLKLNITTLDNAKQYSNDDNDDDSDDDTSPNLLVKALLHELTAATYDHTVLNINMH